MANEEFRKAVTNTAFNLTLSQVQVLTLALINSNGRFLSSETLNRLGFRMDPTSTIHALSRKGLITNKGQPAPGIYILTKAGKLTHDLCIEAGLLDHFYTALAIYAPEQKENA